MATKVSSIDLEKVVYVHGVEFYRTNFDQEELDSLNKFLKERFSDNQNHYPQVTFEDVKNIYETSSYDFYKITLKDTCYNESFETSLQDVVKDYLDNLVWSNGYYDYNENCDDIDDEASFQYEYEEDNLFDEEEDVDNTPPANVNE